MNTVVWIMVTFAYGPNITIGPEFKTQAMCEKASEVIQKAAVKENFLGGAYRKPFCVRIEK
jgi:hypothetical protein